MENFPNIDLAGAAGGSYPPPPPSIGTTFHNEDDGDSFASYLWELTFEARNTVAIEDFGVSDVGRAMRQYVHRVLADTVLDGLRVVESHASDSIRRKIDAGLAAFWIQFVVEPRGSSRLESINGNRAPERTYKHDVMEALNSAMASIEDLLSKGEASAKRDRRTT
jgi:hypothetical protein